MVPLQVAERLVQILIANPLSADRMADALVERVVNATNWDSARGTTTLLEKYQN